MKKAKVVVQKKVIEKPKDDYKPPLFGFFKEFYAILNNFNTKKNETVN